MRLFRPEDRESEHDPRLINAVERGDTDEVNRLLASGTLVDSRDTEECTVLMIAAREGHLQIFEALLKAAANPYLTAFGETALTFACVEGQLETVQSWLDHGLDITLDGDEGIQALLAAACGWPPRPEHVEIIRRLVKAGVKANEVVVEYATDVGEHALSALRSGGALPP